MKTKQWNIFYETRLLVVTKVEFRDFMEIDTCIGYKSVVFFLHHSHSSSDGM